MGEIIQFKKREVVSPKVKPRTNGFSRIIRGRTTGYKFYQAETMKEPITPDFGEIYGYSADLQEYVAHTPYIRRPYHEHASNEIKPVLHQSVEALIDRVSIACSGQPLYPEPEEYKGEQTPEYLGMLSKAKQMMHLASLPTIPLDLEDEGYSVTKAHEVTKRIALATPRPVFTYTETMDPNPKQSFNNVVKSIWDEVIWEQSLERPDSRKFVKSGQPQSLFAKLAKRNKKRKVNKLAKKARRK